MGAHAVHFFNVGFYLDLLSEKPHRLTAFNQAASQRPHRLVAGEYDRTLRSPQVMLQMVADTSGVTHACRRYDYLGSGIKVNLS